MTTRTLFLAALLCSVSANSNELAAQEKPESDSTLVAQGLHKDTLPENEKAPRRSTARIVVGSIMTAWGVAGIVAGIVSFGAGTAFAAGMGTIYTVSGISTLLGGLYLVLSSGNAKQKKKHKS